MWLLYSVVLLVLWTLVNSLFLQRLNRPMMSGPDVSILVPLRNEERNVEKLVKSLQQVTYQNVVFYMLNDHSTDATGLLLEQLTADDQRFTILNGRALPAGWVGKVNACQQLGEVATGAYYCFLDADVEIHPTFISRVIGTMESKQVDLMSGFPKFQVRNLLSKLVIPMMHFLVNVHLPIVLANYTKWTAATAANGIFMCFRASAYHAVGGHAVVKSSLVEDVAFAKVMKKHQFRVKLARISPFVSCDMYASNRDTWEGFVKNTYVGTGRSPWIVFVVTFFYSVFYILPILLFIQTLELIYLYTYILTVVQRMIVDIRANQFTLRALLLPLSCSVMLMILWASMWRTFTKKPYHWKGREYQ